MQREIKFRVWSKEFEKFLTKEEWFFDFDGDLYFLETRDWDNNLIKCDENLYTIQQFTGLLDKHGKDIYEGDIVKYDRHDDPVIIRWTEEGMDYTGWIFEDLFTQGGPFEVIGNIFENSELLK